MNENQILKRLNNVFQDVFDDDTISLSPSTALDEIEAWDSLGHITLIGAVENEFRMDFKTHEVSSVKYIGEMVDIIAARARR